MYNGIGILTPRGTGTSGYVQGNKFNLRHGPPVRAPQHHELQGGPQVAKADPSILEHKAKREIELKVAEEQAKLEDEGCARVAVPSLQPRLCAIDAHDRCHRRRGARLVCRAAAG